jgi:lambda family phage portal protein
MQNFGGIQNLAFRTAHESGDAMVLTPMFARRGSQFRTKVQVIEADRVSTPFDVLDSPTMRNGVEIGKTHGDPIRYWIRDAHPGDYTSAVNGQEFMKWTSRSAFGRTTGRRNAWLLYERLRPGQHRGQPYFSVVLEQLKQLERYTDSELAASVIGGSFTVFVESESGQGLAPLASTPFGVGAQVQDTVNTGTDIGLDYGAIVDLAPGEKISTANPSRPNQAFGDFVRSVLEQIGVGLGIPFELLIKHFTASYSAARAALLEAWKYFLWKRKWFAQNFCQPIYEAVMTEAALQGRLPVRNVLTNPQVFRAVTGASWIGPAQGQVDPLREAKALTEKLSNGVTSLAIEVPQMSGEDWRAVHEQRAEEHEERLAAGLDTELPNPNAMAEAATGSMDEDEEREQANDR